MLFDIMCAAEYPRWSVIYVLTGASGKGGGLVGVGGVVGGEGQVIGRMQERCSSSLVPIWILPERQPANNCKREGAKSSSSFLFEI